MSPVTIRCLLVLLCISLLACCGIAQALEVDDEAIDRALDKAQVLMKQQNMDVQLTDEQRAQAREKLGRMARQLPLGLLAGLGGGGFGGGLGGGFGGGGTVQLFLLFNLLQKLFNNNNNNDNGGQQVTYVPAVSGSTAPAAPSSSALDYLPYLLLFSLILLAAGLLPTGF